MKYFIRQYYGEIVLTIIVLLLIFSPVLNNETLVSGRTPAALSQTIGYNYTQLTGAVSTTSVISSGSGVLGTVIITEDQAGAVVLYDATSTSYLPDSARIADFQTAMSEGEYHFDAEFDNGLVFKSDDGFSFAGDWTILYR